MDRSRPLSSRLAFQIAGTYVGTVVGAGFASGQEVLRFFTLFGPQGSLGLLVSSGILAMYGVAALRLGQQFDARSHRELLRGIGGPWLGRLTDWVVTGFLFAGTGVMMAGSGAIFQEQFNLPAWIGSLAMALAAAVTVVFGLKGVVRSISLVAPVLIAGVMTIGLLTLWDGSGSAGDAAPMAAGAAQAAAKAAPNWFLSAVLYASYNLLLAMPILAPLGATIPGARTQWLGGLLGAAGLGLSALTIHLALLARVDLAVRFEVPMLFLARGISQLFTDAYAAILWAEVYTTAVAGLFSVSARLVGEHSRLYRPAVAVIAGAALLVSKVGFADLVVTLYPWVGYLGLGLLVAVPWYLIARDGHR